MAEKIDPEKQITQNEQSTNIHETISTTNILHNFPRDRVPSGAEAVISTRPFEQADDIENIKTLERLREQKANRHRLFGLGAPKLHDLDSLISLFQHHFPCRGKLPVQVFDFGPGRAERLDITLGDIEQAMSSKPSWATIRWIHAPLGLGLFHSSVEDIFNHGGSKSMGKPFSRAGRAAWPYLETETLNIRSYRHLKDTLDVASLLKDNKPVQEALDKAVFDYDRNATLRDDITWRANHLGMQISYWNSVKSDLPPRLSSGGSINMSGPYERLLPTDFGFLPQSLQQHQFYENSYITRNCFRCFHRSDGYLLVLSPSRGVDYLDKNLPSLLNDSTNGVLYNPDASAIPLIFQEFSTSGIDTWHRKTIEWLLVYMITEISCTPHTLRQGYSVPSLLDAYEGIVHELKERKFDPWKRDETVILVRKYLACIDELGYIGQIYDRKLDFLQRLHEDCVQLEKSEIEAGRMPDNPGGVSMEERVNFALLLVKEFHIKCEGLITELNESMHALFQLRSIEQNELAVIADSQNKAIFVFTGVTLIFLPLSFFTSYYGMNIQGIVDTNMNVDDFWRLSATLTFGILTLISLYAFRDRIRLQLVRIGRSHHLL